VILSDASIREALESGGIVIDPLGDGAIQPSSVDLHVDRYFRVFRNDTTPYIDPKEPQEDLTELVEVEDDGSFILHPGEFVLGSTLERVALSNDLVARLEGKSSLGRLGLLIHSSLPASERVPVISDGRLAALSIAEIVRGRVRGSVVGFEPDTFKVAYQEITGWYEGPPDRIYEVRLASGRRVRVTAGHNLFTIDGQGHLAKARTLQLRPGTRVAIPRIVPDPPARPAALRLDLTPLIRARERSRFMCTGPTVAETFERHEATIRTAMLSAGLRHFEYYRQRSRLPLSIVAQVPGLLERLGPADRLSARQSSHSLVSSLQVDTDFAWLLGLYVAEGSRRRNQVAVANTDMNTIERAESILRRYGVPTSRSRWAITACSALLSEVLGSLGIGDGAHSKRVPPLVFGWPRTLIEAFLDGVVDGDGSITEERTSVWTSSEALVSDLLLLAQRLGRRAGSCSRERDGRRLWQVHLPHNEHKLLTSVPLPDRLLVGIRQELGMAQAAASRLAGYRHRTSLSNLENRSARDAVRLATLRRLRATYSRRAECPPSLRRLDRLVDGDLLWDEVVEVRDTGSVETIFDLEVRPGGRRVENFLAGDGGVFVSNTAGFVDAGWDGHLTLELSNVANLPIAIYPGMKIGQISFLRMTTAADEPYGSEAAASKYHGQRGPTPSRYYLNFPREERS
jgi:deoxycytidine triphosphate deaminase/intein/homing endonuclease